MSYLAPLVAPAYALIVQAVIATRGAKKLQVQVKPNMTLEGPDCMYILWQYWLWSIQGKGTKLERFLAKNQL